MKDSARAADTATGATRGAPAPAGPPPAASFVPSTSPAATPVKGRGFAIASLVCGVLGLRLLPFGLVAIVTGHVARRRLRQSSQGAAVSRKGVNVYRPARSNGDQVMAIIGLVLGYVDLVVAVVLLAFAFAVVSGGSASQSEACQVELRTLRTAQQAFIAERGADPTSQQDLVTAGLLKSPSSNYDLDSGGGGAVWRPVAGGPCA